MKIRKLFTLGICLVSLGVLSGVSASHSASASQINDQSVKTVKPIRHYSRTVQNNHPVFGELTHSYTDWTFNGRNDLWNAPLHDGKRVALMHQSQVQKIAKHAYTQRNPNDLFFLDYTASYKGRKRPTYYFVESYSHKIHGWIYHKGLTQTNGDTTDPDHYISAKDINTPVERHLTKQDYQNADDVKAELVSDMMHHSRKNYRSDLTYATWEAENIGKINRRTRKAQLRLIKKAAQEANAIVNRANHSKRYYRYLKRHLL